MDALIAAGALSFGFVMAFAPLLQIQRMQRTQSSEDVSVGLFTIIAIGAGFWAAYGATAGDWILIVPNSCGSALNAITVLYALRLRRRPQAG